MGECLGRTLISSCSGFTDSFTPPQPQNGMGLGQVNCETSLSRCYRTSPSVFYPKNTPRLGSMQVQAFPLARPSMSVPQFIRLGRVMMITRSLLSAFQSLECVSGGWFLPLSISFLYRLNLSL